MVFGWLAQRTVELLGVGIVDDGSLGARLSSPDGLVAKGAGSSADEGNVALDAGRVIRVMAAVVVYEHQLAMDRLSVLGCRCQAHRNSTLGYAAAEDKLGLEDIAQRHREFLGRDAVIIALVEQSVDNVVEGPLVAWNRAIAV